MQPPAASVGDPFDRIETPALIVDLDAFEANLDAMAAHAARHGYRLRPHAKTHKSPVIGRLQMVRGAVGICVQKVSEAEIMVAGGVDDVLVSNEIVAPAKIARLAALARRARIGVCVDALEPIAALSEACARFDSRIDVMVEIDVGQGRCGVATPEAVLDLARAVDSAEGLRFAGLQAYHGGAQHILDREARRETCLKAAEAARDARDHLDRNGLSCAVIGGAGTGTFDLDGQNGVHTELQPGSYIFMDADYGQVAPAGDGPRFRNALFVLTQVMSRARPGRAVVDAGHKTAAIDSGLPRVHGLADIAFVGASDEHGEIDGADDALPPLGGRLLLVPGHCDPTVNLHDHFVCVRGLAGPRPMVEAIWPVAARGAHF